MLASAHTARICSPTCDMHAFRGLNRVRNAEGVWLRTIFTAPLAVRSSMGATSQSQGVVIDQLVFLLIFLLYPFFPRPPPNQGAKL